jgi:hypothetical protein
VNADVMRCRQRVIAASPICAVNPDGRLLEMLEMDFVRQNLKN